ncbi:MAG TPA: RecX family transcriptional regulator [Bryobacteraceae bacterium]|jgi:regulatory protein|nr:RecX family transcriptional regulator [Bryobacteraceae bacterium]
MPKPPDRKLDANRLMAFAAQALSARALTISELREKLNRRAADPADVEQILARLKESGYLNDQRFAESYASWRRDDGGFGKTRVLRDLMVRRVAPAVAKQAAETAFQGADEIAMIEAFLQRKYRGKDLGALLQEQKHLASAYRKLRMSGFSTGNSIRVLKRYAEQAELLEDSEVEEQ